MYHDRKIGASMRERKNLACSLELKSIDAEGRFAGYASVFNVLDNQKDIILRGAFADTIHDRVSQIKLLWQHQTGEPIGVFTAMFEDSRGLYVEGKLLLNVQRAREALVLLKSGAVTGLSIGYSPVRYTIDPDTGIRRLAEVDLWEVSLVTFPANDQAAVTVVKSAPRPVTRGDVLRLGVTAERHMDALWQDRPEALFSIDDLRQSDDVLRMECKSIRHECEWIKSYTKLLQLKIQADVALQYSDDEPRDYHGRWTSEGDATDTTDNTNEQDTSYHGEPDNPIEPVYPVENALAFLFGGEALATARGALGLAGSGALEEGAAVTEARLTDHGAERLLERGISNDEVQEAVRTAQETGNVVTQIGKYGTPQNIFQGSNGVTAVVETTGRNAGKVITLYRH